MHSTYPENIQEHSLEVAMVGHMLAIIRNRHFSGTVDPERVATLALFHDVSEVLTGDLPTPVKYFNPKIKEAYKAVETTAATKLLHMLPSTLQEDYRTLFFDADKDQQHHALVKAADKICAYMKCLQEMKAGNHEFSQAKHALRGAVDELGLPEVDYFMSNFAPSLQLTLDELG